MDYKLNRSTSPLLLAALLCFGGCAAEVVRSDVELQQATAATAPAEDLLLDVAVRIFAPIQEPPIDGDATLQHLRDAEGHYLSWQLGQTLQTTGHWGTIRLNPFMISAADLIIDGEVLQSDGETLHVHVTARDASGRRWLDRDYYQLADARSYEAPLGTTPPLPYRNLLHAVANDLLAFREQELNGMELAAIRRIAALNFAAEFAPEIYGAFVASNGSDALTLARLPAANDPVFAEIESIRERTTLFLDAIQGQYTVFARRVDEPYRRFLARSQQITTQLNSGINADDIEARYGAASGLSAGLESRNVEGTRIDFSRRRSNRLNTGRNARLYAAALANAGASFELTVAPQTIAFAQRNVTLTGSVEEQFAQWREILREMQQLDTAP